MSRFKLISAWVSCALVLSLNSATSMTSASAETCASYDLTKVFDEEFFPNLKWDNSSGNKVITWTSNVTTINGIDVSRPLNADEDAWAVLSFDAWDKTLNTISFRRVTDPAQADISFGLTKLQNSGYWTVERDVKNPDFRVKGTVQISSTTPVILTKSGFITIALSEIGNLLGLGDIQHPGTPHSVLFDPDVPPFGVVPLSDFDIELMRQFYGESTCKSQWPAELIKEKAATADAAAKAQAEANEAANQDAAKTSAEQAVADKKAQEDAIRASLKKKVTITCVKGKTIKKVTSVNPKCPAGYKKR